MSPTLLSIDLSNYCSKQCSFCYNHSNREGNVLWTPDEVIAFATDCVRNGVKAVSLGGGEPFEYEGIFEIIDDLYQKCYLSVTSNGLPLQKKEIMDKLLISSPDKLHITIHNPDNENEVSRVLEQISFIKTTKIKVGVNLLVGANKIDFAQKVYEKLLSIIDSSQIILIPQRFANTPTSKQLAIVANKKAFQSPSCLLGCKRPQDFVSVSWDKKVNSCSYAHGKQSLQSLDYKGLISALNKVEWASCL